MNTDPSENLVAFEVDFPGERQTLIGHGPARSPECIRTVWAAIAEESGALPEDVRQVYSEWQPSDEDQAFLDATFPQAATSYSFARPSPETDEAWAAALEAAARTIESSTRRKWWQFWRRN